MDQSKIEANSTMEAVVSDVWNQRILWVDIMRGILIILMVFGHCSAPFTRVAYMFHMPAFIFLSGYTARPEGQRFPFFLWKRVKGILIPYVFWNVVFILLYEALARHMCYILFSQDQIIPSVGHFFTYLSTTDLGGATWFLPVLFTTSVGYQVLFALLRGVKHERWTPWAAMVLGILGFWLCQSGRYLPYLLDLSIFGLLFYGLGHLFATHKVLEQGLPEREMTLISAIALLVYGYFYPGIVMNWPTRDFLDFLQVLIASVCGVYLCYRVSVFLSELTWTSKFLSFLGQNTLTVLIFHFAAFRVVFAALVLLDQKPAEYLYNLTPPSDFPLSWLVVGTLALLLCAGLAKLASYTRFTKYIFTGKGGK